MSRRWEHSARGASRGLPASRLASLFILLGILGLIYNRASDPETWHWLAEDVAADDDRRQKQTGEASPNQQKSSGTATDVIVPGPTDEDPEESAAVVRQFAALTDKSVLAASEMPAYWRLMKWSRAQSFDTLESRARRDVLYAQLWGQPDEYRGKLLRLRLHVKQLIEWKAPENSAGVTHTYEAAGATEESKSYPYVVVFSDLPAGMKIGSNLNEEAVFVGYFLKLVSYATLEHKVRATPLLIGRLHRIETPGEKSEAAGSPYETWWWLAGGLVLLVGFWIWAKSQRSRLALARARTSTSEPAIEDWLLQGSDGRQDIERIQSQTKT